MEEALQRQSDVYSEKLVISLEHKYKQETLRFARLKGGGLHRHRSFPETPKTVMESSCWIFIFVW